jgi:dihydropteroate synthase
VGKPEFINVGGKLLTVRSPQVMGIINVTTDSFYGKSRHSSAGEAVTTAARMVEEGAGIIDVGGLSTRPGTVAIPEEEERKRVTDTVRLLRREFPNLVISVDTYRASVASEAVIEAGADMINDISGGTMDDAMIPLIIRLNVPYIMMHIQGTPETMQKSPEYNDVVTDIINWFGTRVPPLLEAGVKDIIIDPGIGFGKTNEHNFSLINRLSEFGVLGLPVMAGVSRKSMIWRTLQCTPDEALNGTTAMNMAALMNGADILRVHDVGAAAQTIRLFEKLRESAVSRL